MKSIRRDVSVGLELAGCYNKPQREASRQINNTLVLLTFLSNVQGAKVSFESPSSFEKRTCAIPLIIVQWNKQLPTYKRNILIHATMQYWWNNHCQKKQKTNCMAKQNKLLYRLNPFDKHLHLPGTPWTSPLPSSTTSPSSSYAMGCWQVKMLGIFSSRIGVQTKSYLKPPPRFWRKHWYVKQTKTSANGGLETCLKHIGNHGEIHCTSKPLAIILAKKNICSPAFFVMTSAWFSVSPFHPQPMSATRICGWHVVFHTFKHIQI